MTEPPGKSDASFLGDPSWIGVTDTGGSFMVRGGSVVGGGGSVVSGLGGGGGGSSSFVGGTSHLSGGNSFVGSSSFIGGGSFISRGGSFIGGGSAIFGGGSAVYDPTSPAAVAAAAKRAFAPDEEHIAATEAVYKLLIVAHPLVVGKKLSCKDGDLKGLKLG
jgi:hypothetical protein